MKKMMMGILVGAGAMYLLDPDQGPSRRASLAGSWRSQKGPALDAIRSTADTVSAVSQRVGSAVGEKVSDFRQPSTSQVRGNGHGDSPVTREEEALGTS